MTAEEIVREIRRAFPYIEGITVSGGECTLQAEFLLEVNGKDMREVSNFVAHKLAPTDGVTGTETMFVLKGYKKNGIDMHNEKEDGERLLVTP